MHLAKHHLELLLHKQPIFLGHQPRPNSLRLVRYSVLLLARLEPLRPNLLRAHLEPLGNNSLPRAQIPARPLAQVLRSRSLNSNKPLHLVPLVNLNLNNNNNNNLNNNNNNSPNNNNRPQALVLVSSVVQVHSGNQSLLQDLQAPSVNQVGPWLQSPNFVSDLLHSRRKCIRRYR